MDFLSNILIFLFLIVIVGCSPLTKIVQEPKKPVKKEPAIREIVKEPKAKKEIPTRASNDPRYKS